MHSRPRFLQGTGTEIEVHVAPPEGTTGTAIVDVGSSRAKG